MLVIICVLFVLLMMAWSISGGIYYIDHFDVIVCQDMHLAARLFMILLLGPAAWILYGGRQSWILFDWFLVKFNI